MAVEDTLSYVDRLYASSNRIDGLYYMAARALGISENMLSLLYALLDGRPRSQKQICEELLIPKTTLNTVVRECVADGYMTLSGGREKRIALTEKGRGYIDGLLGGVLEAERAAMEETVADFGADFIPAIERFESALGEELRRRVLGGDS